MKIKVLHKTDILIIIRLFVENEDNITKNNDITKKIDIGSYDFVIQDTKDQIIKNPENNSTKKYIYIEKNYYSNYFDGCDINNYNSILEVFKIYLEEIQNIKIN